MCAKFFFHRVVSKLLLLFENRCIMKYKLSKSITLIKVLPTKRNYLHLLELYLLQIECRPILSKLCYAHNSNLLIVGSVAELLYVNRTKPTFAFLNNLRSFTLGIDIFSLKFVYTNLQNVCSFLFYMIILGFG